MSLFRDLLIDKKRRRYFCEVEYLESTGTQYIDTGVYPADMTYVEAEAQYTRVNIRQTLLGCYVTSGGSNYNTFAGTNVQSNYANFFAQWSPGNYSGPVASDTNKHFFSFNKPTKVFTVDNSTTTLEGTTSNVSGQTLYMFATHSGSTIDRQANTKIYYLKIKNGDTLVRDFIPVLGWDGKGYMYDRVSRQLFGNAGTGDFSYGREIHPVEYLESTGTQYINTGYKPNTNTECSMDFMFTSLDSTYRTPLSIRTSDGAADSFTMATTTTSLLNFAFGTTYFDVTNSPQANTYYKATLKSGEATLNNLSVTKAASTITPSGLTAYMFARNANGTAANFFIGRIYNCQIKESNTLVRDYIPAISEDGTPFMFDRVTHTCFLNQGTGVFKYPPVELEYLVADGNQYIDTGIQPTDSYGYSIRNSYTVGGGEQCAIGCMDSGNRFVGIYTSGSENAISGAWGDFVGFLPNYTWTTGTILEVKSNYKNSRQITIGDTLMKDITDIHISGTIGNTVYLFARHYGSTITTMKGKMYCAEITNGQNIVATYIPAFKDGAAGMLDKVNNVFYTNAGTGTFVCGRIREPEYE